MDEIKKYFDLCVDYWMRTGLNKGHAMVRAIWWDCVEIWNFEKSWTEEKVKFINQYRQYAPYGPVPEPERVADGDA